MDDRSARLNLNGPTGPLALNLLEVDLRSMTADRGLRRSRVIFELRVTLDASSSMVTTIWLWGDLSVAGATNMPQTLGRVRADEPIFFGGPDQGPQRHPVRTNTARLSLELDMTQVEALEEIRRGGDLTITLRLGGVAQHEGNLGSLTGTQEIRYPVAQSTWIQLLTNLGNAASLILEIPVDGGLAAVALREALDALQRGAYEEAIADCRSGLSAVTKSGDARFKLQNTTQSATKEERFWRSAKGLLTVANLAHHPEDTRQTSSAESSLAPDWTRNDAVAVIAGLAVLARL